WPDRESPRTWSAWRPSSLRTRRPSSPGPTSSSMAAQPPVSEPSIEDMTMDIRGIGYLGFESPNIEAWRSYGPEVLGLAIAPSPEDEPEALYLKMDDRRYRFAFQPGPIDKLTYIGWECINRIAFEKAVKKLQDAGI